MTKSPKNGLSKFARFSGLGFQMGIIIAFFTWLGTYLDRKYQTNTPWWTLGLSLTGVIISLVIVIREVIRMSKEDE
jgi:hypothetical protein